ncbi:hypothetical protein WN944_010277 [Citrus x changshan-huyou]|uniref:Ubiquitin-like protease family profile domain-containing protein n=1 Tax=Citrus x changshan-huyou TaxID=2935761 RepID=A0AAP0QX33_9ROSI
MLADGKPFGFMNPAKVIMAIYENLLKSRLQRTQSIFDHLVVAEKCQLIFIPFIPYNTGAHWVLVLIDVAAKMRYYLDPQGNDPSKDINELVVK